MSNRQATISYWVIILSGYIWAGVQMLSAEPFDALVLFIVTISFHSYRNAVRRDWYE